MTLATDLAAVNDGAVIQDFNSRNAVTGLKAAITTVGARVCTTIGSVTASTTAGGVAASLESLITGLRVAGLMN